jgi:SAM-dependent methyltransferase
MMRRLTSGISALHGGLWLGVLDADALSQSTQEFYAASRVFLDTDHALSGLSNWEADVIAKHAPASGRVLVPAAGAGREIIALASMGYDAVGYDPSPDLVELGTQLIDDTGADATLIMSRGDNLPPDLKPPFDWILFGWAGINHVSRSSRRASLFRSLFKMLEHRGVLIVSFNERDADDRHLAIEHTLGSWIRRVRRVPDAVERGDTFIGYFSHLFTFEELTTELAAAGFEEIDRSRLPFPVLIVRKP